MKRIVLVLLAACTTQDANVGNTTPPPPTPTPAAVFGSTRWALSFGGAGDETGLVIAMDSHENVIAGGTFTSPTDFGSGAIATVNGSAWITKRAAGDGGELWTHVYGTEANAGAIIDAITIDAADNVYVVLGVGAVPSGTVTIDLGGTSVATSSNTYLMKLDPAGQLLWFRGFGEACGASASSIAIGPEGNVYVSGLFSGTLATPIAATRLATDQEDGFVAAFAADGTPVWGHVFTGAAPPMPAAAMLGSTVVLADGDLLVSGTFFGMVTFGGDAIASNDEVGVLARYSATGELRSRTQVAADFRNEPLAIEPDGSLRAVAYADARAISPQVLALADDGTTAWTAGLPNSHLAVTDALTLTDAGNAIIAGSTYFPSDPSANPMYLAAFDSSGAFADLRSYDAGQPNTNSQEVTGVASRHDAIAFTGRFWSSQADFGTGPVPGYGRLDAVIAVIDPP